jgi:soluble lytic murein transglycosylase
MLGKRAADYEIQVPGPYYALHPLTQKTWPVPTELILSIARRESEFDPKVISGVGARGLMQIMPATAKEVSGKLGLEYDAGKLLSDPDYNATLGSAYLAELARRFDGNVVMMAAGYNAGPSRPNRWIDLYGDPRLNERDVIDWIEFIPFRETRNYVMRVAESVPIYRARLGKPPHPVPFSRELIGSTLLPLAPQGE